MFDRAMPCECGVNEYFRVYFKVDLRAILWFNMLWIVVFSTTFLGVSNNCPKINRWLGSMWFHIYYTIQCVVYTFNTYPWNSIQQPHSWGVDPREAPKGFCFKTGFFSPPNAQQPPESESAVSWGWSYLTPAEPQQLGNFKHQSRESRSELQSQTMTELSTGVRMEEVDATFWQLSWQNYLSE